MVEAKGEIAALASTINGMIDTLATFAAQVTNGASEYISKPVDTDQLVSMMRVWLGRV